MSLTKEATKNKDLKKVKIRGAENKEQARNKLIADPDLIQSSFVHDSKALVVLIDRASSDDEDMKLNLEFLLR